MKRKRLGCLGFFLLTLVSSACAGSPPSESDARAIFERSRKQSIDDGSLEIGKFRKTNSQLANLGGVELYTLWYEVELVYPKGQDLWCRNGENVMCIYYSFREIGQRELVRGSITFEKREKGWVAHQSSLR